MILVFSGTGNTLAVARLLADELGETVREFTPDELTTPERAAIGSADNQIIWMFPTYSWGVPPVILNLISKSKFNFNPEASHFMVTTAGDDSGMIADQWRKALSRRGISGSSAYSVQMPNTYTMMKGFDVDSPEVIESKLSAMPARVKEIASRISDATPGDDLVKGSWPRSKTRIVYPWFKRYMITAKGFHTNDRCTRCGWCIRHCPLANITTDSSGHPQWGNRCTMCERCYHGCPSHAVEWRKATRGKGQYTQFINLLKPSAHSKK